MSEGSEEVYLPDQVVPRSELHECVCVSTDVTGTGFPALQRRGS